MNLIVGLGNPTQKYKNNRHNIGFMSVDFILKELSYTKISKSNFKGELFKSGSLLLLKPQTYMNLSGESVSSVVEYFNIEKIIVIHDDLDIPFGQVRYKFSGSNGGHNGLKSIDKHLKQEYYRIRIGIGRPMQKSDVISYVLKDFTKDEFSKLNDIFEYVKELSFELSFNDIDKVKKSYPVKKVIFD